MSDFDDLRNLERNVLENHKLLENVETVVKHLDWSTFHTLPTATETRPQERFDLIFAADVIFEKNHTEWIHATVSTLLAFPTFNSDPTFYVILQLRTSHFRDLLNEFEQAFSELSSGFIDSIDEDRVRWKLRIRQKKKLKGSNGFSSENDEQNYLLFEIRWASIDS